MMPDQERSDQSASLRAAALLVTEGALVELSAADAREVVSYMRPQRVGAGQIVIRAGEPRRRRGAVAKRKQEGGQRAGADLTHVPFQGGGPANAALLGGHIDYKFDVVTETAELHRTGGRYALVTMCIGGGQGIAAIFERV